MTSPQELVNSYLQWLKQNISVREADGWMELTTPFLDRHNDHLQVNVRAEADGFVLTDDGYVLRDLELSGCDVSTAKRQELLRSMVALLSALAEQGYPADPGLPEAEARILQLGTVGLDVDSVSSTVLVANLTGAADPVLAAMSRHGGGWPVPLHALRNLRLQSADGRPAYVVENPPVFEHLERATRTLESSRRPALVCTGGFLSAAGVRLLDALQAAEFRLWYGGDFDRNGLTIAASLMNRYPGLRLWHMGPVDYLTALDPGLATRIPNPDLEWLAQQTGALAATAAAMAASEVPAYQERLVAILAGELSGAG